MAYISVNKESLKSAANAITAYNTAVDMKMRNAEIFVQTGIKSNWAGQDSTEFLKKWSEITATDSTFRTMKATLIGYYDFLKNAESLYAKAQEEAVTKANKLKK